VHELILERYCFVLGWITLSDIDVKEVGALPWSPTRQWFFFNLHFLYFWTFRTLGAY